MSYTAAGERIATGLRVVYERLLTRHGPQGWWPAESPFEMAVGAILTQSTAWANVRRAIANLKAAEALDPAALAALPMPDLAALVRPSGYFNVKAAKVKAFVSILLEEFGGEMSRLTSLPTTALRGRLLGIYGIGPETADSIALYAGGHPLFVVDAYTRRLCHRLGLAAEKATYAQLQEIFAGNLPVDVALYNEYHALIVAHGKDICRAKPRCEACVLSDLCPTGKSKLGLDG